METPAARTGRCGVCGGALAEGPAGRVCPHCSYSAVLRMNPVPGAPADLPSEFELLQEIGRGAMGIVWLARERSLDRIVALKVIAGGADPQLRSRLLREGQAAARLRHPRIVAIHAMGERREGAFLAMDYLEGGNLEELLAAGPLPPERAARLTAELAGALSAAHAAGVLHRDIKPSNILLDAAGAPHLADFGLAAPIEGAGDLTLAGQVAGTPSYLAPELLGGADHASVASDVYGLGAVLYRCLAGRPPFTGDSASSIFNQIAQSDVVAPRRLRPEIPRDLETICLKCLEKESAARYATADDLRADLERYLRREPISARPLAWSGKTLRWCRRRPAAAAAVGLAAALLLVICVGGPLAIVRIERARRAAAAEAASSRAVTAFLQHDFLEEAAPDNEPNRELTLRTVLDRASAHLKDHLAAGPSVEASVEDTLASTYASLGLYALAQAHWEHALALRQTSLGPEAPATARSMIPLIDCLRSEGKVPQAVELGTRTVALARRILGRENLDTLTATASLATALDYEKKFALAEPMTLQVLSARERLLGSENRDTILSMSNLAFEYEGQGEFGKAEALCRRVLELRTRLLGPDNPDTLLSMNNLGAIYSDEGRLAEAASWSAVVVERFRRVCGPEHPKTLIAMSNHASTLRIKGDYGEAEASYRAVLATRLRVLGPDHPSSMLTEANLGETLRLEHRLPEAEAAGRDAWQRRERVLGPDHPDTLRSMLLVAKVWGDQGRFAEAEALCRSAGAQAGRVLGARAVETLGASDQLADLLLTESRWGDAEPVARSAAAGWALRGEAGWQLYAARSRLGGALLGLGRMDESAGFLDEADERLRTMAERIPMPDRHIVADTAERLASVQGAGRPFSNAFAGVREVYRFEDK